MSLSATDEVLLIGSLTVYSLVGVTGNVLILLVYLGKSKKLVLAGFIRLLGILDLLVCTFIIPYTITFELHYVTNDLVCRFFELLRHFSVFASNVTLLAIAVERYYAVCRPLKRLSEEQVSKGVFVIVIVSFLMAIPSVFMFAVFVPGTEMMPMVNETEAGLPETEHTVMFCQFTTQYLGETGTLAYQGFQVFLFFGAILVLTVFYVLVYTAVWKRSRMWMVNQIMPSSPSNVPPTSVTTAGDPRSRDIQVETHGLSTKSNIIKEDSTYGRTPEFLTVPPAVNYSPKVSRITVFSVSNMHCNAPTNSSPCRNVKLKDTGVSQSTQNASTNFQETTNSTVMVFQGKVHTTENWKFHHHKTATMLFVCTLVFIITWIPFWLDIFNITKSVPLRFQFFISYASNPLIYGIVNKQVRLSMLTLFRQCGSKLRSTCSFL